MPAIPDTSAEEPITGIKGFDSNLRCRGFQFEVGKTYEHTGAVVVCDSGFHAISGHPLEVFQYYPPAGSRYAETTQSGALGRHSEDSKVASAKITINAELHIPQIVERAIAWVLKQTISTQAQHTVIDHGAASSTGYHGAASSTGDQGAASSTGYRGAASSTGDHGAASSTGYHGAASSTGDQGAASSTGYRGAASSTGYRGAASSTGDQGAASSTGDQGAASSTGYHGAAMATGYDSRVMGAKGNALFLVLRDDDGTITHAWAGIAGRKGIKPTTWYSLGKDGKPFEVAP